MKAKLHLLCLFAVFIWVIPACEKNDSGDLLPNQDWFDILELQSDFNLFAEAASKSGLRDQLDGTAYTLFAPGDSIFQNYLDLIGAADVDSWINQYGPELVRLILNYHIIHGPGIRSDQFVTSFVSTNAHNKYGNPISLHIWSENTIRLNSYANLVGTPFSSGHLVIHEIDRVLYLPSVIDIVAHDPEFSLLRQGLQLSAGGLDVLMRQENESFCLFAPTNRGFQDFIGDTNDFNDFKGFTQYYSSTELRDIFLYHMLSQVVRSDSFSNGAYPTRLSGQSINLSKDIHGGISIIDTYGNKAGVMRTDIHALNGIVHSVDYVLLPQ
jgi:transforming growth factor-beta-induced protein